MKCARCGGRVFLATDEHGLDDSHCVVCGERVFKARIAPAVAMAEQSSERRGRANLRWKKVEA